MPDFDDDIDRLYQLPLDEFTAARNALAKEAKRPTVKDLEKPNVAAWAVNQLYWHHRAQYDRLVKASERLRSEHRKLLSGKSSDIRETERAHRDAIHAARLYLGTDVGVFVSVDGGQRWLIEETGYGPVVTEWLTLHRDSAGRKRLFAFTHGRGVWRVDIR